MTRSSPRRDKLLEGIPYNLWLFQTEIFQTQEQNYTYPGMLLTLGRLVDLGHLERKRFHEVYAGLDPKGQMKIKSKPRRPNAWLYRRLKDVC